jgi:hypothetical protein
MFGSAKTFKGQSIYLFLHNYFLIAVEGASCKMTEDFPNGKIFNNMLK